MFVVIRLANAAFLSSPFPFLSAVSFLRKNLPVALVDGHLAAFFRDDPNVAQILNTLHDTLEAEGRY